MSSFLQSSEWAKFQESVGHKTFRLASSGVERIENKLVIKNDLPLGLNYLYSPRPDFASDETLKKFLDESAKLAKSENSIFLRFEPDLNSMLHVTGYTLHETKNRQPQDTLILDLTQSEETLLANMHQKTRYNIRLAEKHGIKIKKSTDLKDINIFYNLAIKTSKRDGFNYHPRNYYKKMMEVLGKDKIVELYIAYASTPLHHKSIPIAAILVLFYENTAIYLHGASDHSFRNLMAPYLLQWHAIKDAKNNGCKTYDFWGVTPQVTDNNQHSTVNEKHPWAGVTRFKTGFAPNNQIVHYPNCYDIIYKPFLYSVYNLVRSVRK